MLRNVGRPAEALPIFEENLALRRQLGDQQGEGVVLTALGQVAQARGQLDVTQTSFEQARSILRAG
jgi:hypothetical protein